MVLPEGTVTRDLTKNPGQPEERRERTTIDLALCTMGIANRVLSCGVRLDLHKGSDHLPIETTIALDEPISTEPPPRRAWKKLDAEKFAKIFDETTTVLKGLRLANYADVDTFVRILIRGAQVAAEDPTPLVRSSLFDKAFWTPECGRAVTEASRLRWKAHDSGNAEDEIRA